MSPDGSTLKRL